MNPNRFRTALCVAFGSAGVAAACPVCDSAAARQTRVGIRDHFAADLTATVLPLAVLAAAVAAVRFAPLPAAREVPPCPPTPAR